MAGDILGIGQILESTLGIFSEVINACKYTYEEYSKYNKLKKEEMSKFLKAAQKALNETLRYFGGVPHIRDYEKEEKLSELWSKVAIAALPFNPDLAQRCYLKSEYWANPERWTDEQIDAAKIRIVQMEKEIEALFGGKRKRKRQDRSNGK